MIKRRFYKHDHGDRSDVSDSSSSDSDLGSEEEVKEEVVVEEVKEEESGDDSEEEEEVKDKFSLFGRSRCESESSSDEESKSENSDLLENEEDDDAEIDKQDCKQRWPTAKGKPENIEWDDPKKWVKPQNLSNSILTEEEHILQCKSVFKCRICPKVVCLSVASLEAHLKAKKHARSKKLLKGGRLKQMLNSDGEIGEEEEEQETHAERHARVLALAQNTSAPMKNKGRQRQAQRRKAKLESDAKKDLTKAKFERSKKKPAKKKRKIKD